MFIWDFRHLYRISDIFMGNQTFIWDNKPLSGISDIYLGYHTFIWDFRYLYWISDIYIGFQTFIWDFRHLFGISDGCLGFQIFLWDVRYLSGISDIFLGFQVFIWDFRPVSGLRETLEMCQGVGIWADFGKIPSHQKVGALTPWNCRHPRALGQHSQGHGRILGCPAGFDDPRVSLPSQGHPTIPVRLYQAFFFFF